MKNNTFAMEAAPSAIPPNPNMAATIAIMKKITDQRNITHHLDVYREKHTGLLSLPSRSIHPIEALKSLYQGS